MVSLMKWLLLHVLFDYYAYFLVIFYLFSFILISQFHFIVRQIHGGEARDLKFEIPGISPTTRV